MDAIVRQDSGDVQSRLAQLGLKREHLIEVVKACVAGFTSCTDNDPPGAPGWLSWRWGVRRAREVLLPLGWEKSDSGISTVVNRSLKLRLAILNADEGAGSRDAVPQNRSRKGPNSERLAQVNRQMMPGAEDWPIPAGEPQESIEDFSTWHLCVNVGKDQVTAELTLLSDFEDGYFTRFIEKIIIVGSGEWNAIVFSEPDDDSPEPEVRVVRK